MARAKVPYGGTLMGHGALEKFLLESVGKDDGLVRTSVHACLFSKLAGINFF